MSEHQEIVPWDPNAVTHDLSMHVGSLGLTGAQAIELLRNQEAQDDIRISTNLATIQEQGEVDEQLDLRLVPYGARVIVSVETFRDKDEKSTPRIGQEELTFVKGAQGFRRKIKAARQLLVYSKLFGDSKKYEAINAYSQPDNHLVGLSGAEYLGYEEGGMAKYQLVPHVTKLEGLSTSGNKPVDWVKGERANHLHVVGGKSGKVQAAVLEYQGRVLNVFGEPFNILRG